MERGSVQAASSAGIIRKPQASGRAWNAGQARKKAATTAVSSSWYSNAGGKTRKQAFAILAFKAAIGGTKKVAKYLIRAHVPPPLPLGQIGLRERERCKLAAVKSTSWSL